MCAEERSEMPSVSQEPLPRNALSSVRLGPAPASRLGHRDAGCRRLFPARILRMRTDSVPVHAPRCQRESRFLWTSASLADFCNLKRRAGTPDESSILARERGFRSAAHRHQPMPIALASAMRCRIGGPASHNLHATARRTPRSTCVDRANRGPKRSSKGERAFLNDIARALLVALRAPGSPARFVTKSGTLHGSSFRPRSTSDVAPRRAPPSGESRCLLPRRNPYATGGLLPRARPNRRPVTPPPQRHCSGAYAPLLPVP